MIQAAYNFVPLLEDQEKEYYSPTWRDEVSHDIPFRDEKSGVIELKLEADTPLFVKGDDGKFVNINDQAFIPGTSIKGSIRSVLEIMSFGHLNEERVMNDRFPYRCIDDTAFRDKMSGVHCGWLIENEKKILDHGAPGTIRYEQIVSGFSGDYPQLNADRLKRARTVGDKYRMTRGGYITSNFKTYILSNKRAGDNREIYQRSEVGTDRKGTIVFTGNIFSKKSDYIIFDNFITDHIVEEKVLNDFKTLNTNRSEFPVNRVEIGDDEEYSGIPVFFLLDDNGKVSAIGLSPVFKHYAKTDVSKAIPAKIKGELPDLADVMFGSTKYGLKGRIQFGHAEKIKGEPLFPEGNYVEAILNEPKASFYPTYLKRWNTWDSDGAVISGRKRYPIKPRFVVDPITVDNQDVRTKLYPIKEAEFTSKVYFHNLKDVELGALLSAITFHGKNAECKHSLGGGKALGFGSIKVTINKLTINRIDATDIKSEQNKYLSAFKTEMEGYLPDWADSIPLRELYEMAKGIPEEDLIDTFTPLLLAQFRDARLAYLRREEKGKFPLFSEIINPPRVTPPRVTIESLEDKAGFYLEEGKKFRCNLNANNMVSILSPDRENRNRIDCPFEICDTSPVKAYKNRDYAEIRIVDIFEDDIDIEVLRIIPPR